ncbi:uncharacterized protein METZ01_LOCUS183303 [marine metagenome]|uniref:Uncharacterized protein n=1 Tax=marine metagenome TaxID=408172 RepID=A0A382CX73_9ZZZZ
MTCTALVKLEKTTNADGLQGHVL